MAKYDSYVICTSPRSGSTLLCKLLAATGVSGNPASYFYDPSVEDWLADLNVEVDPNETESEVLKLAFRAVVREGRKDTGMFGLRQQAHGLAFLCEKLAVLYPREASCTDRFQQAFGTTLFIHLTRADKIAQGVSYLKAKQTGLWHVAPDGSELERNAPHREPSYDGKTLQGCIETMIAFDCNWNEWFLHEGIEPLRISYDDLAADPVGMLRNVLGHLGLERAAADGIMPGVRKLADTTSMRWAARFRAEHGLS
jgi:trehalose 2-sulfotransferase